MNIEKKLNNIKKLNKFTHLLSEVQSQEKVINYYNTNQLAYRLLHNKSAYLHMGITNNSYYKHSDLLAQIKIISKTINQTSVSKVLELGYGRGANLYQLAKIFPHKEFTGVDISTNPLPKYRLNNIHYIKADYNNLSSLKDKFDLVFAIETLCHSNSIKKSLQEFYSVMKPGAILIIFDGYYLKAFDSLNNELKFACRLVERGMAVDHFHQLQHLRHEIKKNGFNIINEINYSKNILPTLLRFERLAKIYFQFPLISKIVNKVFPEMITRNTLSGYLMPELIQLEVAGYYMHELKKA